ncbi:protein kinase domain-containing protein [Streptomyces profundus]|uniref:protein kinase domain-containing protein n=1 Tax=Streptomyces profundus TaxID=2867410 RepID=UPI001D16D551|nr:proprotein convertase P-domain-containing protein [Streptomyces sp. MA3_2.13]UED88148.1 proprotein convertase P-domain-containing protein [Streptomyces sp. MA3_2.13]
MDHTVGPGKLIGGRYELTELIGSGGFGRVWKARDQRLQADVALKGLFLPPSSSAAEQEDRIRRSEREVLNAARLRDHPHIVSVHDVVVEDDIPWIAMQLVVGRSLGERLQESGPLSLSEATDVARAMLKALAAAHGAGIVHRDIKPANVLLADNGAILLTDFGIATHETDVSLTVTGSVVGSAPYMAPERVLGEKGQAPSDLFSLGVTLHEAVEGASPFDRGSTAASLHAVAYDDPPQLQRAEALAPLVNRLLAKAPGDRPTIAEAFDLLDAPPVSTPPPVAATPTAIVTELSTVPPQAMPTATAWPTPLAWAAPPTPAPPPPPSRGSGLKWLGWIVALGLGVLVVVLIAVNRAGDSDPDDGGGGAFANQTPVQITDNATAESTIEVVGVGGNAPRELEVAVDISHEHINDLELELVAPDGTAFELEAFDGPHEYTVDASAARADGMWALVVRDTAAVDEGTLNSWSLRFGAGSDIGGTSLGDGSFTSTTPVSIPDEATIESTIDVAGVGGSAPQALRVAVDISHEHVGDLELELVAPDGTAFELEAFDEPHEYTVDASAAGADGMWVLVVRDTAGLDEGTLNSWSLRFGAGSGGSGASGNTRTFTNTASLTIEENVESESTIEVSGIGGHAPGELRVTIDIEHRYVDEVELELVAPDGTAFELDPVDGPHEYTVDASAAGADGTWTLKLTDDVYLDDGTLNSWSLSF